MTMLKVEDITFARGEGGRLIPQIVPLETFKTPDGEEKPTIKAIPFKRSNHIGKIKNTKR